MKHWFSLPLIAVVLTGVASAETASTYVSVEGHGDKPGSAFVVKVTEGKVTEGTFFILDPNKLEDFSAGRAIRMENIKQTGNELRFSIELGTNEKRDARQLMLVFKARLGADEEVDASLEEAGEKSAGENLKFKRRKP